MENNSPKPSKEVQHLGINTTGPLGMWLMLTVGLLKPHLFLAWFGSRCPISCASIEILARNSLGVVIPNDNSCLNLRGFGSVKGAFSTSRKNQRKQLDVSGRKICFSLPTSEKMLIITPNLTEKLRRCVQSPSVCSW